MTRKTYVIRDGALVPKSEAAPLPRANGPHVMNDIRPFVTTDGVEITSRSSLRAYEQRTGLRQVGNDWTPPGR